MIKRDFTVWDFVKQGPKKETSDVGTTCWSLPFSGVEELLEVVTHVPSAGTLFTIDVGTTEWTTTVSDLTVLGSADIPPSQGQMFFDTTDNTTKVFVNDDWVTLSSIGKTPRTFESDIRKLSSLWTKFKNLFKFKA